MATVTKIPLYNNHSRYSMAGTTTTWMEDMAEMFRTYLKGDPVYVEIKDDPKRVGSIGRLKFTKDEIQDLLHGGYDSNRWHSYGGTKRQTIEPLPENVDPLAFARINIPITVVWDDRNNKVTSRSAWSINWLKGHEGGTVWHYGLPEVPQVEAKDKLGRTLAVGDFISYILYQFDGDGAAGIYYGKVTKIEKDGSVYARNIKLKSDDRQDEKRIKENGLIVIMTKDIMDQLMMAKLSAF